MRAAPEKLHINESHIARLDYQIDTMEFEDLRILFRLVSRLQLLGDGLKQRLCFEWKGEP